MAGLEAAHGLAALVSLTLSFHSCAKRSHKEQPEIPDAKTNERRGNNDVRALWPMLERILPNRHASDDVNEAVDELPNLTDNGFRFHSSSV